MDKRGDYKWGILLSLILGLMVLSLSIYFIFNELWSGDDQARQICRQSIQLRSLLPEAKFAGLDWNSFKDDYPLKCETHVVEIDEGDVEDIKLAQEKIAGAMAECWALYDKGDASAFPSDIFGDKTICVPCARVHLTDDAKKKLGDGNISIRSSLDLPMTKDYSYYKFLKDSGEKFPAFNLASGRKFYLNGSSFFIDEEDRAAVILKNKLTGGSVGFESAWGSWLNLKFSRVYLPEFFNTKDGDLLINYGIIVSSGKNGIGDYAPYLFYFQTNQKSSPFEEVKKDFSLNAGASSWAFCENWEGIPA